jgi:hypothetical protein
MDPGYQTASLERQDAEISTLLGVPRYETEKYFKIIKKLGHVLFFCVVQLRWKREFRTVPLTLGSIGTSMYKTFDQCLVLFTLAQESIPSLTGRYDNPLSSELIPGLLMRLQIRTLEIIFFPRRQIYLITNLQALRPAPLDQLP